MRRYEKPLTPERIDSIEDREIDFSDIPELDDGFWKRTKLLQPDRTEPTLIERAALLGQLLE